jgi:AAA domain-containing protein
MPNNCSTDSECEDRAGWIDDIRIQYYKTQDHRVFSVYRGNRNWKRLKPRKGSKAPLWIECPPRGLSHVADEEDECWLNSVWENPEDYLKVERFSRKGDRFSVPRLDLLTWEDIPCIDPCRIQKTKWLIHSFLAEKSIQLVFGERGSFKSTLLLSAARAVANGEEFLGMKTRCRWVLYLDYENPANIIKARNDDLGLNLPENPNLKIWDRFGSYSVPRPGDSALEIFVKFCVAETGHGPWIIFDSWSSLLRPGEGGEFTGHIASIYAQLRRLVDLGATITVLDHSLKYERGTLYGGQDKEAKVDSIHKLLTYVNRVRPQNPIIRVESWLKRYAPQGEGSFAFEVRSRRDPNGDWHIVDLVSAGDPIEAELSRKVEIIRKLIVRHPNLGQEALARLAMKQGIARNEAIEILKAGTGKHWHVEKIGHNKSSYSVSQN